MSSFQTPTRKDPAVSPARPDSPDSPDFTIFEIGRLANSNQYGESTPTPVFGRTTKLMSQAKARAAAVAAHQEQTRGQGQGPGQSQRQGHGNLFMQRKSRPEHHKGTRVYAPKAAAYADRPAAPLQMFRSDPEPTPSSIFSTGARSRSDHFDDLGAGDFYTDPEQASADLKALLEGGMDEDDEDGEDGKDGEEDRSNAKRTADSHDLGGGRAADRKENGNGSDDEEEREGESARQGEKDKGQGGDEEQGANAPKKTCIKTGSGRTARLGDGGTLEGLNVKLLPHQVEGVRWMRGREFGPVKRGTVPKGGILADDMGLGKTLQTISLLLCNRKPDKGEKGYKKELGSVEKSTLVVAPLALIRQWEAEIKEKVAKTHKLSVCVHHGPNRTKRFKDLAAYDVVITTYQILVSEHGKSSDDDEGVKSGCFGLHWWRVVLDEAHSIKNRNAKASKACYALSSEYRWCLSGTPMQNNLDELQSLVKFLRIRPYDNLVDWKEHIERPMKNGKGHVAIRRLHSLLRCFMKRRTKEILKKDGALNPGGAPSAPGEASSTGFKVTQRKVVSLAAEFSPAERTLYNRLEARADKSIELMMQSKVDYANALTMLLRLRQACDHPELLRQKIDSDMYHDAVNPDYYQGKPKGGAKVRAKAEPDAADMDSVADLFADMGLVTKSCTICNCALPVDQAKSGPDICQDCSADLGHFEDDEIGSKQQTKRKKEPRPKTAVEEAVVVKAERSTMPRRPRRRNVVLDSDDEDEDASWLVPEDQRGALRLGKAGGEEDENAEGGGDWIGDDDSKHESEDGSEDDDGSDLKNFVVDDDEATQVESLAEGDSSADDELLPSLDALQSQASTRRLRRRSSKVASKQETRAHAPKLDGIDSEPGSDDDYYDDDGDSEDEGFPTFGGRLITPSAKIRRLMDILEKEVRQHKFIVFSEFTSMMNVVELFFGRQGIRFTRYDGKMRNDEREESLRQLRNDPKCRVLLCSLKCGSLGLNLTAATRVVILEPFWNPFVEEQAIDRVHRLTQTVDVVVYKITIKDTVEERILDLQDRKRLLAEQAIEGGTKGALKLGMTELMALFRHDDGYGHGGDGVETPGITGRDSAGGGHSRKVGTAAGLEEEMRSLAVGSKRGRGSGTVGRSKESEIYGRRW